MSPEEREQRLSRISTQWTLHRQAHAEGAATAAQAELLHRYLGPAYRYLLAAVRNADAAEDLVQEFALRFVRGDFRKADPGRGRFRDYLRVSLSHMASDHRRSQALAAEPMQGEPPAPEPDPDADEEYRREWRQEILQRTWEALAAESPIAYAALKLRADEPELASPAMAERLAKTIGKPISAEAVRKAVQRGHEQFGDLLIDEVAATMETPSKDLVEDELKELGLHRYCRSALERRISRST